MASAHAQALPMLGWIVIVRGLQLAGELLAAAFGLSVAGPVIGMVLLLAQPLQLGRLPRAPDARAMGFARHLYLAGAGAGAAGAGPAGMRPGVSCGARRRRLSSAMGAVPAGGMP